MELAGLKTVGERVARLRSARGIKNPAALARLIEESGYSVQRQTMSALERNKIDQPRQGLINALAQVLKTTPEYLLHGERSDEHPFNEQVRGLLPDLSDAQQDQLLYLANEMAKDTRRQRGEQEAMKRAGLSDEEAEVLAWFRSSGATMQSATLAGIRSGTAQPRPARKPRQGAASRQERTA